MKDYESKNGVMMFAGMPVTDIADRFGTPVYVTDEQRLRENYRNLYNAFSQYIDTKIHYACKANTSLAILSVLAQEGSGIDAVSIGEVMTALKAGIPPEDIMYTGVNVSDAEMKAVTDQGVMINVDSVSQLERLAKINKKIPISFRITPEVGSGHSDKVVTGKKGSKFGIPKADVIKTYVRAKKLGFDIKGIRPHRLRRSDRPAVPRCHGRPHGHRQRAQGAGHRSGVHRHGRRNRRPVQDERGRDGPQRAGGRCH